MNRLSAILLLSFILGSVNVYAQCSVNELDEEDLQDRPSGVLGAKDILVQCQVKPGYTIEYSVDKKNWTSLKIVYLKIIEVKLDEGYAYFFVRICDNSNDTVNCRNIKLTPGRRYAIRFYPEENKVKLVTSKS